MRNLEQSSTGWFRFNISVISSLFDSLLINTNAAKSHSDWLCTNTLAANSRFDFFFVNVTAEMFIEISANLGSGVCEKRYHRA